LLSEIAKFNDSEFDGLYIAPSSGNEWSNYINALSGEHNEDFKEVLFNGRYLETTTFLNKDLEIYVMMKEDLSFFADSFRPVLKIQDYLRSQKQEQFLELLT